MKMLSIILVIFLVNFTMVDSYASDKKGQTEKQKCEKKKEEAIKACSQAAVSASICIVTKKACRPALVDGAICIKKAKKTWDACSNKKRKK